MVALSSEVVAGTGSMTAHALELATGVPGADALAGSLSRQLHVTMQKQGSARHHL